MQFLSYSSRLGRGWLEVEAGAAGRFSGSVGADGGGPCGTGMPGGTCMPGGTPLCQPRVGAFHWNLFFGFPVVGCGAAATGGAGACAGVFGSMTGFIHVIEKESFFDFLALLDMASRQEKMARRSAAHFVCRLRRRRI